MRSGDRRRPAAAVAGAQLLAPVWVAVRRGQWRRWWLGPAAGLLVFALSRLSGYRAARHVIMVAGVPRAHDPLPLALARLPLSMFAPARMLPCGFAVAQVTIVLAVAQVLLGLRLTVAVAMVGHALATLSARLWIALGTPIGVAHRFVNFPDSGPSVAMICLAAYLAVRGRAWLVIALLVAYDIGETMIFQGLSQREHLVGVVIGALLALLARRGRHAAVSTAIPPRPAWSVPTGVSGPGTVSLELGGAFSAAGGGGARPRRGPAGGP